MPIPPPREPGLDPVLLEIIVCPSCRAGLDLSADDLLVCEGCGLGYPVRDGIPVLLVDEALPPGR